MSLTIYHNAAVVTEFHGTRGEGFLLRVTHAGQTLTANLGPDDVAVLAREAAEYVALDLVRQFADMRAAREREAREHERDRQAEQDGRDLGPDLGGSPSGSAAR